MKIAIRAPEDDEAYLAWKAISWANDDIYSLLETPAGVQQLKAQLTRLEGEHNRLLRAIVRLSDNVRAA